MEAAAERLAAFCEALQGPEEEQGSGSGPPGLTDRQLANLLSSVPGLLEEEPTAVRAKLDEICAGTGMQLPQAAGFITRVPAAWDRPVPSLLSRLEALRTTLASGGVGGDAQLSLVQAAQLLAAVPPLFGLLGSSSNSPTLARDRFEMLSLRLGQSLAVVVQLLTRQPVLWSVPPTHIQTGVTVLRERLALSEHESVELVARVPVVLALEPRLLALQVGALAPLLGVPTAALVELLGRCLGLVAVPAEVLGANLSNLAEALGVHVEAALDVAREQPLMLAAPLPTLAAALDCLEAALSLPSRDLALRLLCQQPALLTDQSVPTLHSKLEDLAALFKVPVPVVRDAACQQPTLLLMAPFALRALMQQQQQQQQQQQEQVQGSSGGGTDTVEQQWFQLAVEDPVAVLSLVHVPDEAALASWSARLGIDPDDVKALMQAQPALTTMAPVTVKARLESLSALFATPLPITCQLVCRHPVLATLPPSVVIARVKNLSLAWSCSMQTVSTVVAKAPALLACAVAAPGELNRDLKPHVDAVHEVAAAYEFYTMDWLRRGVREAVPQRMTSFSQMDTRK